MGLVFSPQSEAKHGSARSLSPPAMDQETGVYQNHIKKQSWKTILTLAYQSLGVVYGDLSTSPLYVYKSTFAEDIDHSETNEEIFGVLSFVFWTLTLIPLLKYVFIVLKADDNGEGGTFALYSLLCRHARVSSLPNSPSGIVFFGVWGSADGGDVAAGGEEEVMVRVGDGIRGG